MQALGGPSFQRLNRLACEAIRWRLRFLTDRRRRFVLKTIPHLGESVLACAPRRVGFRADSRLVELGLKAKGK